MQDNKSLRETVAGSVDSNKCMVECKVLNYSNTLMGNKFAVHGSTDGSTYSLKFCSLSAIFLPCLLSVTR